jgi:hypothetical protein
MLLEATRTSQVKPSGNALTPPKSDEKYGNQARTLE